MRIKKSFSGFSLVEVTLAIGIAAFTLLAIFGLMPLGMNAAQNSSESTIAAHAASVIISDLKNTRAGATESQAYGILMDDGTIRLDDGGTPIGATGGRYRATLNFTPPTAMSKLATYGVLTITWPADAPVDKAQGRFQTFFALDRN